MGSTLKIAIHAGHGNPGGTGQGAVAIMNESEQARNVIKFLKDELGIYDVEVVDVTVYGNGGQQDILNELVKRINDSKADVSISIHLNASVHHTAYGSETWFYVMNYRMRELGAKMSASVAKSLGTRDRGASGSCALAVLKRTKMDSLLVECAFCDSSTDANLWDPKKAARGIAEALAAYYGLMRKEATKPPAEPAASAPSTSAPIYRVQVGAYRTKQNALAMADRLTMDGYNAVVVESK